MSLSPQQNNLHFAYVVEKQSTLVAKDTFTGSYNQYDLSAHMMFNFVDPVDQTHSVDWRSKTERVQGLH